jgi:hypothetical protein
MKKKANRTRSAKRDLPARKTGGVKGGVERASTQILPYIEQDNAVAAAGPSAASHVKVFSSHDGFTIR